MTFVKLNQVIFMKITPLYELLILIEDRGSVSLDEVQKWGRAMSRGMLGKMEAMKLVEKRQDKDQIRYSLSEAGHRFLNSILDVLHRPTIHWDKKWRLVWFSIPEKQRSKRDKFRRSLEGLGLRPILNSLWITPLDKTEEILKSIRKWDVLQNVIMIESDQVIGIDQEKIASSWDFEKVKNLFLEFIEKSENLLSKRSMVSNFEIKKMIFEYALILNGEPAFPIELLPRDWPKFRAHLQYKKLRRIIS
jgi:phenylacetic acid degradation operon negative regulatory protein